MKIFFGAQTKKQKFSNPNVIFNLEATILFTQLNTIIQNKDSAVKDVFKNFFITKDKTIFLQHKN